MLQRLSTQGTRNSNCQPHKQHPPFSSRPQVNDSIQLDLATNKVQDIITFEVGNLCMVTGGANAGRVGTMISRYEQESQTINFLSTFLREKHPGSFDIVHIKDSQGHVFATRLNYVFVIGKVGYILLGEIFI